MEFLGKDVSEWEGLTSYQKFANFVTKIRVTNDTAERGVKLVQDFINSSTNESLRQDLMLAVSANRKERSTNLKKKML